MNGHRVGIMLPVLICMQTLPAIAQLDGKEKHASHVSYILGSLEYSFE